jgi:hypothetical protein
MNNAFLYRFIQQHPFAVMASVTSNHKPEAACIGIAVTPALHIIFDTLSISRKFINLQKNPHIALVIGTEGEQTLQYEGIVSFPTGEALTNLLPLYFEKFPRGRERKKSWPHLSYVMIQPTWIRFSDFSQEPPLISETTF